MECGIYGVQWKPNDRSRPPEEGRGERFTTMVCDRFKEGLASLAQGQPSPAATAHVATCPDCAWRLTQMKRLVALLEAPHPSDDSARARFVARIIGGGRGQTGARRHAPTEFALHVAADRFTMYLSYAPFGETWEVLGRAPDEGWIVVREESEVPCGPAGRFRLLARNLDDTGFTLRNEDVEIAVPSAPEMIDLGA